MAGGTSVESKEDFSFGQIAIRESLATLAQVREGLAIQAKLRSIGVEPKKLGEILIEKGILTADQAAHVYRMQVHTAAQPKVQIPGYTLLAKIGSGGMGSVFKARQDSMDRIVAIKVLSPKLSKDRSYLDRFLQEARAVATLNHENVIAGFDAGEVGGLHYFVMEYVDGTPVSVILEKEKRIEEARCVRIGLQVARALEHAHRNRLVHRDIKPENLIVTAGGIVKLCDLGLAKRMGHDPAITSDGMAVGTPNYISPEQAKGKEDVDIRSDIYSLGASLYHMGTGTILFGGASPMVIMTRHVSDEPEPPRKRNPALSEGFERLVLRMIAKGPEERHQTPTDLIADLERLSRGEAVSGVTPSFRPPTSRNGPPKTPRTSRRYVSKVRGEEGMKRGTLIVIGVLAVVVLVLAFLVLGRRG